jgi:hypothetical protein
MGHRILFLMKRNNDSKWKYLSFDKDNDELSEKDDTEIIQCVDSVYLGTFEDICIMIDNSQIKEDDCISF